MRWLGGALIVVGTAVFLVSLLADLIGVGDGAGFQVGPRQAGGIALGLLVMLIGALIVRRDQVS